MTFKSDIQVRRTISGTFKDSGRATALCSQTEDPDRFEKLLASLIEEFQPRTPTEFHFVETMAVSRWRLIRNGAFHIALLKLPASTSADALQWLQREKRALKCQYSRARRNFLDFRSRKNLCAAA